MPTTNFSLTSAAFTSLGTVPCTIINDSAAPVVVVIDASPPGSTAADSFEIEPKGSAAIGYTGQSAYARALDVPVTVTVVR